MAWLLAFVAGALAGPLQLHASPDADVVALPRLSSDRIEIGVYRNQAPIAVEVARWEAPGLLEAKVVNVGGGTAFVVMEVSRPDLVATVVRVGEVREIRLGVGRPVIQAPLAPLSIEELFAGVPRQPAPPPKGPLLLPLLREARTFPVDPRAHRLAWSEPFVMRPAAWDTALAPTESPTQDDLTRWRAALTTLDNPILRGLAHYRLGMAHRAMGMHREAGYYLNLAVVEGFPPSAFLVARADAALGAGHWEIARQMCQEAWVRGASDETALECLGLVSLATDSPSPAAVATALGGVATRAKAKRLAGELFLRDGYASEAIPLLAAAAPELSPGEAEAAYVALGDAYVLTDAIDLAREAYLSPPHAIHGDVLQAREVMIRLLTDGVRRFPAWVPTLTALANQSGPGASDALYLLAQLHEHYLDHEAAAQALTALWDRGVHGGDIPDRLLRNCSLRVDELARGRRDAETIAMLEGCWRADLAAHVADVAMLDRGAQAYERLGLFERALALQTDLTQILAAVDQEDADSIGRLAALQAKSGFPDRAIETVAYGRRRNPSSAAMGRLDLVHGDALVMLKREDSAIAQWKRAAAHKAVTEEALRRIARLELETGRCTPAAVAYAERLRARPLADAVPGHLELAWARCTNKAGKAPLTLEVLTFAVTRSQDEAGKREARWLANAVALRAGLPVPEALASEAGPFPTLREEEAKQRAFDERMTAWQRGAR